MSLGALRSPMTTERNRVTFYLVELMGRCCVSNYLVRFLPHRTFPASKLYVRTPAEAFRTENHHHRARDYDLCHGVFVSRAPESEACEGVSGATTARGTCWWFSLRAPVIRLNFIQNR